MAQLLSCPQERSTTAEEHQQEAERLQARLSGQQSAGAELQEELGEQQLLLQRAQEARRAAAEVSTPAGAPCHSLPSTSKCLSSRASSQCSQCAWQWAAHTAC